jgi:hypothetical protein
MRLICCGLVAQKKWVASGGPRGRRARILPRPPGAENPILHIRIHDMPLFPFETRNGASTKEAQRPRRTPARSTVANEKDETPVVVGIRIISFIISLCRGRRREERNDNGATPATSKMGGLFEAPFLYQPSESTIPLRRRENDAFASPSRNSRVRIRRSIYTTGSSSASTMDHHGSGPDHLRHHWCIKTAMKAILVSPIVVIVLWSLMAMLFTHKIRHRTASMAHHPVQAAGSWRRKGLVVVQPPRHRNAAPENLLVVPPSPPSAEYLQLEEEQSSLGQKQYYYSFPDEQQQQQQNQQQQQPQRLYGAAAPLLTSSSSLPDQQELQAPVLVTQQDGKQYYYSFPNQQRQQPAQQQQRREEEPQLFMYMDNGAPLTASQQQQLFQQQQRAAAGQQLQGRIRNNPMQFQRQEQQLAGDDTTTMNNNGAQGLFVNGGGYPMVVPPPAAMMTTSGRTTANDYTDYAMTTDSDGGNNNVMIPPPPMVLESPPIVPVIPDAAPLMGMRQQQQRGNHHGRNNNNNGRATQQQQQQPQETNHHVRYYYYDPKTVVRDARGNVYLPTHVYDPTTGRAIDLQSLSSSSSTNSQYHQALRLEAPPPPRTILHHNVSAATDNDDYVGGSNFTHPEVAGVYHRDERNKGIIVEPPLQSSTGGSNSGNGNNGIAFIEDWGKSHVSDSSVIVVTVGVMALLVGALSARKLRSRNMLSACIENETLEDDAAYDALYTTHQYQTFQQGWKGDLEKFDV